VVAAGLDDQEVEAVAWARLAASGGAEADDPFWRSDPHDAPDDLG
jgi:hypothetical protein